MNLLHNTRVYLAGPVDHDPDCASWRDAITPELVKKGITVFDPLVKPAWLDSSAKVNPGDYFKALYDEESSVSIEESFRGMDEIRKLCLAQVAASDFIICHLPKIFTVGTISELERAAQMNKPVLFHCPDRNPPSTWALQHAKPDSWREIFFDDWAGLLSRLDMIDNGVANIDPLQWVFVAYTEQFHQSKV